MHEKYEKCVNILVEKCKRKRPLGSPRHKWDDNIKIGLRITGWEGVESIHLAQDRVQR